MNKYWLRGRTVLVVGALSSIGIDLIYNLISNYGCRVLAVDTDRQKLKKMEDKFEKVGKIEVFDFDVNLKSSWELFVNNIIKSCDIDILINCGTSLPVLSKFENIDYQSMQKIIGENLYSNLLSTKLLLPILKKSKYASIVNVLYNLPLKIYGGYSLYKLTYNAILGYTEILSKELEEVYFATIFAGDNNIGFYKNQSSEIKTLLESKQNKSCDFSNKIIAGLSKHKKNIYLGNKIFAENLASRYFPRITNLISKRVSEKIEKNYNKHLNFNIENVKNKELGENEKKQDGKTKRVNKTSKKNTR